MHLHLGLVTTLAEVKLTLVLFICYSGQLGQMSTACFEGSGLTMYRIKVKIFRVQRKLDGHIKFSHCTFIKEIQNSSKSHS